VYDGRSATLLADSLGACKTVEEFNRLLYPSASSAVHITVRLRKMFAYHQHPTTIAVKVRHVPNAALISGAIDGNSLSM
jgi:hypothetical protein